MGAVEGARGAVVLAHLEQDRRRGGVRRAGVQQLQQLRPQASAPTLRGDRDRHHLGDVVGRSGRKLHEVWNGEPQALLGIMTPNFPNFFMMYGPNTNGGAIVTHLEAQASYIAAAMRRIARGSAVTVEPRETVTTIFNDMLQQRLAGASFQVANNYYKSSTGRIVTQWSDGAIAYVALTKLLRRVAWKESDEVPAVVSDEAVGEHQSRPASKRIEVALAEQIVDDYADQLVESGVNR